MQIGDYSLGQNVSDQPQLTEISQLEYNALPKTFVGEKILRAPDTLFLGHLWNIRIGAINDRIYKLSAQFESDNDNAVDTAYSKAIDFCTTQYGAPFLNKGGKVIGWDTPFGNIIVDRGSMLGSYYANFQVTSGSLVKESRLLMPRITTTRMIVGFFFSAVSAYSFSFSIDLLLGGLFAIYPEICLFAYRNLVSHRNHSSRLRVESCVLSKLAFHSLSGFWRALPIRGICRNASPQLRGCSRDVYLCGSHLAWHPTYANGVES